MTAVTPGPAISRGRVLVYALVGALALAAIMALTAIVVPTQAEAKKKKKDAKVSVMARNVYLGADLTGAIEAEDLPAAVDAAGAIYNETTRTDFPERAVPLAKEINKAKPDLVGLQEVAHWRVQQPSDGGWTESGGLGEPATETRYDFLQLLLDELGGSYKVVAVQEEFDAELPADIDGDSSTFSTPPELQPFLQGADLDYRLTMRDVILQRKGAKVKAKKKTVEQEHYETLYTAEVGGVPITADRGWQSVEAKYNGGKKRKSVNFRFVNTHLEAFGDPEIREAQAKELFQKGGPLKTKKRAILVGDLNSGLKKPHRITGKDQLAFEALKKFGMKDRGTVQSCCYPSALDDPSFVLDHTVDHVLVNKKARAKLAKGFVTGDDASEMTPSGLWPSDHGGVYAKLKLR